MGFGSDSAHPTDLLKLLRNGVDLSFLRSAVSAQPIPSTENGNSLSSNSSAESTNDSTTSPVLSSSPLGTLDSTSRQRGDNYEGNSLEPSANGQNGSPIDSENTETDPLIAYRRELGFPRPLLLAGLR